MGQEKPPQRESDTSSQLASTQLTTSDAVEWAQHPSNPFNWSLWQKWTTMGVACWVTFIVGLNATSITTASTPISSKFHLSNSALDVSFLPSTAWNAAAAVAPLVTLPLMDTYGVRAGYVVSLTYMFDPVYADIYLYVSALDLLYFILHLPHTTSFSRKLRNPCGLSRVCWYFWRYCAECR